MRWLKPNLHVLQDCFVIGHLQSSRTGIHLHTGQVIYFTLADKIRGYT